MIKMSTSSSLESFANLIKNTDLNVAFVTFEFVCSLTLTLLRMCPMAGVLCTLLQKCPLFRFVSFFVCAKV